MRRITVAHEGAEYVLDVEEFADGDVVIISREKDKLAWEFRVIDDCVRRVEAVAREYDRRQARCDTMSAGVRKHFELKAATSPGRVQRATYHGRKSCQNNAAPRSGARDRRSRKPTRTSRRL